MNTERVVAILVAAGLRAAVDTRRLRRAGFRVRQFSRTEVGVVGHDLTQVEWSIAMGALESAGLVLTYRCDEGLGARVRA